MGGRTAEITVDLVLQVRAKLSDNKVNGPDDGKNVPYCEVFSGMCHGPDGISKFVEDREIGPLEETGRCLEERDQKLQGNCVDISDVEVVCILYHSSPGKRKKSLRIRRICMLEESMG